MRSDERLRFVEQVATALITYFCYNDCSIKKSVWLNTVAQHALHVSGKKIYK